MAKREKLEIMKDILKSIRDNHLIKFTPLLRKSGLSSNRFKEYYLDLLGRKLIRETNSNKDKRIILTEKGLKFLERYSAIIDFISEFDL